MLEADKALMTEDGYRSALRSPLRGLWTGVMDRAQFRESFRRAVEAGFTAAWRRGAEACGIKPEELTQEELFTLDEAIVQEWGYIDGLADAIEENSRDNDGKLGPLNKRLDLWVRRFKDVENRAKAMACKDQKLRWVINPAKETCCSCIRLNGKVKRASFWQARGVRPQHPSLHCMESAGGPSVCGCRFEVTDAPLSKGPLPNWRC